MANSASDFLEIVMRQLDVDTDSEDVTVSIDLSVKEIERLQGVDRFWQEHGEKLASMIAIRGGGPGTIKLNGQIAEQGRALIQPGRVVATIRRG